MQVNNIKQSTSFGMKAIRVHGGTSFTFAENVRIMKSSIMQIGGDNAVLTTRPKGKDIKQVELRINQEVLRNPKTMIGRWINKKCGPFIKVTKGKPETVDSDISPCEIVATVKYLTGNLK